MNSFKKLKKIVYDFDSKIKQCKILKIQISDNNFENYRNKLKNLKNNLANDIDKNFIRNNPINIINLKSKMSECRWKPNYTKFYSKEIINRRKIKTIQKIYKNIFENKLKFTDKYMNRQKSVTRMFNAFIKGSNCFFKYYEITIKSI